MTDDSLHEPHLVNGEPAQSRSWIVHHIELALGRARTTPALALHTAIRGMNAWLALIMATTVMSVLVTLDIALMVAGNDFPPEEQFTAIGGTALGFCMLVGLLSLRVVIRMCMNLQHRTTAQWMLAGVQPRSAFAALVMEIILVGTGSGLLGALVSSLLWPAYARFVITAGVPRCPALSSPIPMSILAIGTLTCTGMCMISGVISARTIIHSDVLIMAQDDDAFRTHKPGNWHRITSVAYSVCIWIATVALYIVIAHLRPVSTIAGSNEQRLELGNYMSTYAGMGIMMCLAISSISGPIIRGLLALVCAADNERLGTAWFLATREAAARATMTRSFVLPIALTASAVGVIALWIDKLRAIFTPGSVSADPKQMAVLFGGSIIAGCVCSASIVLATMHSRNKDSALLLAGGSTVSTLRAKAAFEVIIYMLLAMALSYLTVWANELAMDLALKNGPVPQTPFSLPGWQTAVTVVFGVTIVAVMLSIITAYVIRHQVVSVILNER